MLVLYKLVNRCVANYGFLFGTRFKSIIIIVLYCRRRCQAKLEVQNLRHRRNLRFRTSPIHHGWSYESGRAGPADIDRIFCGQVSFIRMEVFSCQVVLFGALIGPVTIMLASRR